jgi:hypothetical protein
MNFKDCRAGSVETSYLQQKRAVAAITVLADIWDDALIMSQHLWHHVVLQQCTVLPVVFVVRGFMRGGLIFRAAGGG